MLLRIAGLGYAVRQATATLQRFKTTEVCLSLTLHIHYESGVFFVNYYISV